jgi:hypothetical protein
LKKAKPKKKRIPRPRYKKEFNQQAYELTALGATDKNLARFFKVTERAINLWKEKHSEFVQSLKKGKYEFDTGKVVSRLLRRALGYQYQEETQTLSEGTLVTTKVVIKDMAPDPTSMIFWLKNRQPDEWRDKQSMEHGLKPEVLRAILAGLPKDFANTVRKELARLSNIRNS